MAYNTDLNQLLEKAKKDLGLLKFLKNGAVKAQLYELGAALRDIEKTNFPESDEQKEAEEKVKELDLALRMVEVRANANAVYRITQVLDLYRKKKGKLDLVDASKIIANADRLFPEV